MLTLERSTYLGPARIEEVLANRVRLRFPDQEVWATLALSFGYSPVADDVVLAISHGDDWYVIGVIHGKGKTVIRAVGDLELHAPAGKIELRAARGIRLQSPAIRIAANTLDVVAKSLRERLGACRTVVKTVVQLVADRFHAKVSTSHRIDADSIVHRAEEDLKLDARKIQLG